MKPLLVGMANPYQRTEEAAMRYAFFPEPRNASGDRLCRLVMGLDQRTYLRAFDRIDLCHPAWSMLAARTKAAKLRDERTEGDIIVCCGEKVAAAFHSSFGNPFKAFTIHRPAALLKVPTFVLIPHPSGLSRAWDAPGAYERARAVLREAGALPAVATAVTAARPEGTLP